MTTGLDVTETHEQPFIRHLCVLQQLEQEAEKLLTIPPVGLNSLKRLGYDRYGFGQALAKAGLPNLAVALMDFHHLPHGLNLVVNQYALTPFGTSQRVIPPTALQHLMTAEVRLAAALAAIKALTELRLPPEGLELQWPNATATLQHALQHAQTIDFANLVHRAQEAEAAMRQLANNPQHPLDIRAIALATGRVPANLEERVLG